MVFWDLFGEQGHPIRTTISEIGPLLLARILNLNDTQEGVLSAIFRIADDQGLLLIDFKDLKAMISYVSEHAADFKADYGNLSPASLGAIQRNLLALADQGGEQFFGEPALDLMDFLQTDSQGHGNINLLAADKLMNTPKLYATFLLWMLSELFEQLPGRRPTAFTIEPLCFSAKHRLVPTKPPAPSTTQRVPTWLISSGLPISHSRAGPQQHRCERILRKRTIKD